MDEDKLNELFIHLETLKLQISHLVATVESEKGTLSRETQRIREDIAKVDSDFKDIFYGKDRVSGFIVEFDRLKQESLGRKRYTTLLWGTAATVVGMLIKTLIELFKTG